MKSNTVVADPPSGKALGSRRQVVLKNIFATSPLYAEAECKIEGYAESMKITETGVKSWFQKNVLDSAHQASGDTGVPGSGGYYGINGSYSMDFAGTQGNGPPDFVADKDKIIHADTTQAPGAGGNPATPFVPNPASPGADPGGGTNVDATKIPAADSFVAQIGQPTTFGSGQAANTPARNPAVTSSKVGVSQGAKLTLGQSLASVSNKS